MKGAWYARCYGRAMVLEYVHMGIAHIGASVSEWYGPHGLHLPEGVDHLLFLAALALGSHGILETVKAATGFTLGHSITLALAALGWVRPPAPWVEVAIAASIVYLAGESFMDSRSRHRWGIAAAFGLVHGFGFASALTRLDLGRADLLRALLGFNLGVEIGQLMILAVLVPLVLEMRKQVKLRRYGLRPCSAGILGAGAYWLATRALALVH